jgi:uroporphyrinogen-III synthase
LTPVDVPRTFRAVTSPARATTTAAEATVPGSAVAGSAVAGSAVAGSAVAGSAVAGSALAGRRVIVLESRRAAEMASLVARQGGEPIVAPTMREVPLTAGPEVRAFAEALRVGALDVVILLTGVGTRALAASLEADDVMTREALGEALSRTRVLARGPKTVAALKELRVSGYLTAPEPHTWRELLEVARGDGTLRDARVAVQLYGAPHPELTAALEAEGARVESVPVYRWQLPDDVAPALRAVDALLAGDVDAVLFTSAQQLDHWLEIAAQRGEREALLAALGRTLLGSIGPTCTERLVAYGLRPAVQPEHAHMGHLVKALGTYLYAHGDMK